MHCSVGMRQAIGLVGCASQHGSCCVGGKQLGQKDFEQEGQGIVPPNVSTSPQDVHLSLGEGQGLGSS